jgi:60 kDa SS-A/Ro ribonucleoprotein
MPALLCALLIPTPYFGLVFRRVINNGKMLRNFAQIVRSGQIGRQSFGNRAKNEMRYWFTSRLPESIFHQSSGSSPSFADILRMIHVRPSTPLHDELYKYLLGVEHEGEYQLPILREYEAFKQGSLKVPMLPFTMLHSIAKTQGQWTNLALHCTFTTIRMNLNLFQKHGLFENPGVLEHCVKTLSSPESVSDSRVYPYQLMNTALHIQDMPERIQVALNTAMELATRNVPELTGNVIVCPDISGSMDCAVTGVRKGATSTATCRLVAALITACISRKNPERTKILAFSDRVFEVVAKESPTVMAMARFIAGLPSGGTNCSLPMQMVLDSHLSVDLMVYASDNQSWADFQEGSSTEMAKRWQEIKQRNPNAKLVLIDLAPCATTQCRERADVLNIGGFSDSVFDLVASFARGDDAKKWVDEIKAVDLMLGPKTSDIPIV